MENPAEKYKSKILNLVFKIFRENEFNLYLFGSMANNTHSFSSDIDLAIESDLEKNILNKKINLLKNIFDESNIPYKIDLINLNTTSNEFKNIALRNIKIWHQKKI